MHLFSRGDGCRARAPTLSRTYNANAKEEGSNEPKKEADTATVAAVRSVIEAERKELNKLVTPTQNDAARMRASDAGMDDGATSGSEAAARWPMRTAKADGTSARAANGGSPDKQAVRTGRWLAMRQRVAGHEPISMLPTHSRITPCA
jgi:hypothetical protein